MRTQASLLISIAIFWSVGCSSQQTTTMNTPPSADTRIAQEAPSPPDSSEHTPSAPPIQAPPIESTPPPSSKETQAPQSTGKPAGTAKAETTTPPTAVALSPTPPQSVLLRLNLKPNTVLRYESILNSSTQGSASTTLKMLTRLTVKQNTQEGYVLTYTIEEIKPEGGPDPQAQGFFDSLKNTTMEIEVNKQGKVLRQKIQSEQQMLKQIFQNLNTSRQSLSPSGMTFPPKPIQVGTRWTDKMRLGETFSSMLHGFTSVSTNVKKDEISYVVKEIRQRGTKISVVIGVSLIADVEYKMQPPPNASSQQAITGAIKTTGSGTIEIDASTGILLHSTMDTSIESSASTFNIKQSTKAETRLIE